MLLKQNKNITELYDEPINLVFEIVDKEGLIEWLYYRTWTILKISYDNDKKMVEWLKWKELDDIKEQIISQFALAWRTLSETEYLDCYIEDKES